MSSPSAPPLQQLHQLDRSSPGFSDQLCNVLYGREYSQCTPNLQDDDLAWLVDYLDKALDGLDRSGPAFQKCLRELRIICGSGGILPISYTLEPHLLTVGPDPFAAGGYGDIYEGFLDGSRVCIKRIKVYTQDDLQKTARMFCQQAVMWKNLTHPNIVPLLGITIAPFQFVSELVSGGDLLEYIKKNPDADRVQLLSDVAKGLDYLHSSNVIYGDLKGPNILIDAAGHARITDFDSTTVATDMDSEPTTPSQRGFTPQWTAPEVLEEGPHSKEADIFAFAMVMIEMFTGAVPFSDSSPSMAMLAILQGKRPQRPTHPSFTENLWILMQRCWDQDPHLRPEVSEVLQVLLTPELPAWKRLISHPLSKGERTSLLISIFNDRNEAEVVGHLLGDDAQTFVNVIDEALDTIPQEIRRRCLRSLYRICARQALLPRSLEIPLCYNPMMTPQCHGGFGDVWKGQHDGREVAAKALRVSLKSDLQKIRKRFCREVVTWNSLRHPNVLPLLGVTMSENWFVMISEWMVKGNINDFVKADRNADRLELLRDITRGLIYMHGQGIVHGDLKGANILIDHNGHACLADFSLVTIISEPQTFISTCIEGGTTPWMSPELLDPESFGLKKSRLTKESDCYALGMVVYEVLSGRAPFAPSKAPVLKILRGEHPERPQEARFTDGIWGMLELCWNRQPGDRPSLNTVFRCLQDVTQPLGEYSDVGGDAETDANDQSDTASSDSAPSIADNDNGPLVPPQSLPHARRVAETVSKNGHAVSQNGGPPGVMSSMNPPDGGELPAPRQGGSKESWVIRLARKVRRKFETSI